MKISSFTVHVSAQVKSHISRHKPILYRTTVAFSDHDNAIRLMTFNKYLICANDIIIKNILGTLLVVISQPANMQICIIMICLEQIERHHWSDWATTVWCGCYIR